MARKVREEELKGKLLEKEHLDPDLLELSAKMDDMNPEFLAHVFDRLFAAGAKDVWAVPILMKKGRPAVTLKVLCPAVLLPKIEDVVFAETTTLGLRYHPLDCHRLEKRLVEVETPWGKVPVKLGYKEGQLTQISPEFEACKALALKAQVPLKAVYEAAKQAC